MNNLDQKSGLLAAAMSLALIASCTGEFNIREEGAKGGSPEHMDGAGNRRISEYWPSIDIPLSQNTRMLGFSMMKNEVLRATGQSWEVDGVDQWDQNRSAFGGADYVETFSDDLIPSQQRILLWRKMAFQVCTDLVDAEAGNFPGEVFSEVDPQEAIGFQSGAVRAQIGAMHRKFFLEDAESVDESEAIELLQTLSPAGDTPRDAWRGLCVAYLGSMRFVTY